MILMNVNSKDAIDIENVFLVLDKYDYTPAKNDNRYISLSRADKTRSFLITRDNMVYGLSLKPDAFIKKYYKAFEEYGKGANIAAKITTSDYYIGIAGIILITDTLTRVLEAESKRLENAGRSINLNPKRTKSYLFVKGTDDNFVVKSNMAKSTILSHIREAVKKHT